MPNPFAIRAAAQDSLWIIEIEGFLDAHTAPQFERAIQQALEAGQSRFIIDCGKLNYISSAGLGVFMSFIEEVREKGGDIKICGLVPKVRHTFEILGFQDIFDLLDDVPAAVRRFSEAAAKEA